MGKYFIDLTNYLGVLACTIVSFSYKTSHDVPNDLKDKLWGCFQVCNIHTSIDIFVTLVIPYNLNVLINLFHLLKCFYYWST